MARKGEKREYVLGHLQGFTLVELVIVVVLLGILATIAIVGYNGAQVRSRDAQRKANLEKIASSLEMYHSTNKSYPCSDTSSPCDLTGKGFVSIDSIIGVLAPYIVSDPTNSPASSDKYYYLSDGKNFKVVSLVSELLSASDSEAAKSLAGDYYDGSSKTPDYRAAVADDIKTPYRHYQVSSSVEAVNW